MKKYDEKKLREKISESHSIEELMRKMNLCVCTHSRNILKREILRCNIDIGHFSKTYAIKQKAIHKDIVKIYPTCLRSFTTRTGGRETAYCSRRCSNSSPLVVRLTEESKRKISKKLTKPSFKKKCPECGDIFLTKRKKVVCCSNSCARKRGWKNDSFRQKIISSIRGRVESGKHKGWTSRTGLSYPEKFFKKVFESNKLFGQFEINYPVKKKDLGINCNSNYFLDFYFPHIGLDVEIDGGQHKLQDRKKHDAIRDLKLRENGYVVYRIPWRSINTDSGKKYIKSEIEKVLKFIDNLTGNIPRF